MALLQTAESQVEAVQASLNLAQNRLSYTRLVSEVSGVVTARGAEPGEVVGAGRMIVQVAREGARDALFGVPAQIKDSAPAQSRYHGRRSPATRGSPPRARCVKCRPAPIR